MNQGLSPFHLAPFCIKVSVSGATGYPLKKKKKKKRRIRACAKPQIHNLALLHKYWYLIFFQSTNLLSIWSESTGKTSISHFKVVENIWSFKASQNRPRRATYIMHTYLTYVGEDVRISMAMTIGKFKLNFLIVLWTITFSHNYAVKFIHRISANLLKTVFLCQFLEHIELPYSPKNLEILEDLYQQVSHSCEFEVECQWCYCNTHCTPHIFRQVLSGQLYPSTSPPNPHSRIRTV